MKRSQKETIKDTVCEELTGGSTLFFWINVLHQAQIFAFTFYSGGTLFDVLITPYSDRIHHLSVAFCNLNIILSTEKKEASSQRKSSQSPFSLQARWRIKTSVWS